MAITTLPSGSYGPQTVTAGETLLSDDNAAGTVITNPGGNYTFGINVTVNGVQIGDLSGDGFDVSPLFHPAMGRIRAWLEP